MLPIARALFLPSIAAGAWIATSLASAAPPAGPSAAPSVTAPTPAQAAEAKRHFELGLKLYKEKIYEPALTEFLTSYELNPRPSALRNAAQCQRDLRHFAEAHAMFTKLLAVHATQLNAGERDAIKRALVDLELLTGTLQITVNDADAELEIDGHSIGKSPLSAPARVDVGSHKFRVTHAGREPWEKSFTLAAQQSVVFDVTLTKEVLTGTLKVKESAGKKLHVFVDDTDRGVAPLEIDVTAGMHTVEVRGEGVASERQTVEIVRKGSTELTLKSKEMKGRLRVETLGKAGAISVDGNDKGEGTWEGELPVGSHRVRVLLAGFAPAEHLVVVKHGETVVDAVTLVPGSGPVPFPFRGLYGRLGFFGAFSLSGAGDALNPACDASSPPCSTGKPIGAATLFGAGYAFFDWLAVEVTGGFMADYHTNDRTWTGKQAQDHFGFKSATTGPLLDTSNLVVNESFTTFSLAGYAGVGPRVTSADEAVRFTFGMSIGGAYRSVNLKRAALSDSVQPGAVTKVSPTLVFDGGILFGSTPGTKFSLGIVAWLEFAGDNSQMTVASDDFKNLRAPLTGVGQPWTAASPTPPQSVLSGTQIYIGPRSACSSGADRLVSDEASYDCQACGACCHGPEGWVHVDAADDQRVESSPELAAIVELRRYGAFVKRSLRMVHGACAGLAKTEHGVSCGVYEDRPAVCRELAPGSKECLGARRRLGVG